MTSKDTFVDPMKSFVLFDPNYQSNYSIYIVIVLHAVDLIVLQMK